MFHRQAFSLVEVLIGLLVLAVALLALAAVPPMATKLFVSGADHEKAMSLAMNKLEELEGMEFSDSLLSSSSDTPDSGKFERTWTVSPDFGPGDSDDDFVDLTMTITWDAVVGDPQIVVERRLSRFGHATPD